MKREEIVKLLEKHYRILFDAMDPYGYYELNGMEKGYFVKIHKMSGAQSSSALLAFPMRFRRRDFQMYEEGFQVIHAFCFSDGIQLYKYRPDHISDIHSKIIDGRRKYVVPHSLATGFIKAS